MEIVVQVETLNGLWLTNGNCEIVTQKCQN